MLYAYGVKKVYGIKGGFKGSVMPPDECRWPVSLGYS